MNEAKHSAWEDFEAAISSLFEDIRNKAAEMKMSVSQPLFRGHTNASWKLETTLERFTTQQYSMHDYYKVMYALMPAVQSFTDSTWALTDDYAINETIPSPPLGYDFMIYLRHHGFPSPLLDWTRSPYVAAFFAFRAKLPHEDEDVAIYSYVEYCGGLEMSSLDEATMVGLGPYVTTHKRHFTQQSEYTICKKRVDDSYLYCSHEEVYKENGNGQGHLTKHVIPGSERMKVLEKLHLMNINAYSLFGHEESLMETLAYQEIERKNH